MEKKKKISFCRICDNPDLVNIFDFGDEKNGSSYPLILCDQRYNESACGLLQRENQEHEFLEDMNYRENQGNTEKDEERLKLLAHDLLAMSRKKKNKILDLCYGTGKFLSLFPKEHELYGFDSAFNAFDIEQSHMISDLNFEGLTKAFGKKKFDIISQLKSFNFLDDPMGMAIWVKKHLASKGIWVLEIPYMPFALSKGDIGFFHPANAIYPTLHSLGELASQAGLKIVRMDLMNGDNNAVYYITHLENTSYDLEPWLIRLSRIWDEEASLFMGVPTSYQAFLNKIEEPGKKILELVSKATKDKKKFYIYGTNCESETLAYLCGLINEDLVSLLSFDENHSGSGILTNLPIVEYKDIADNSVDYFLVPIKHLDHALNIFNKYVLEGAKIIVFGTELLLIDANNIFDYYEEVARNNLNCSSLKSILKGNKLRIVGK